MDPSLKIDEGYSEDPESPMRLDAVGDGALSQSWPTAAGIPPQIMALNEAERSDFVYNLLRTLRTSSIAEIVDRLRPLLHIDPVTVLPPEITSEIFSYLTPSTLLEASRASRAWRERALDSRLWRLKFRSEGWGLDMDAIRQYELEHKYRRKARSRRAEAHAEQSRQKKRVRGGGLSSIDDNPSSPRHGLTLPQDVQTWNKQHGEVEADEETTLARQDSGKDEEMYDVDTPRTAFSSSSMTSRTPSQAARRDAQGTDANALFPMSGRDTSSRQKDKHSLIRYDHSGIPQVNYNHVYKQKRKLEENWESGAYQSFQLPHRDHPEEAHKECVYTIQYSGKYLVSGSRDKTLRKWNLDTQRLVGQPLEGHNASVLCLQFDSSEGEDIIASGSSDTDVILWQFSTGKMIRKIPRAHDESVLNLKFDSRFLVTCSKDKTIKIWNRQELRPGDRDYPVKGVQGGGTCPAFILDLQQMASQVGPDMNLERHLTAEEKEPIAPYTPIMVLESHNAAVNAIHIYKDQLVSASGDRHVHLWDIHTGVRTSVCRGHTKGIACVQYDGKRIVSGSSDNTIRIFDPITQAEVACLTGHARLVRTIQSAFGDLPGKREELEAEAIEIDGKFHEARRAGKIPIPPVRTGERNAGSRDPKDMMALGAKLPPGGGGSRWGRIVSGSYDETVIIWKKLADGRWAKAHVLRQEEALRAAGGPLLSQTDLDTQAHQQALATARNYAPLPPPTDPLNPQNPQDNQAQARYRAFAAQLTQAGHQPGPSRLSPHNGLHSVTNPPYPFPQHSTNHQLQQQRSQQQQQYQQQHRTSQPLPPTQQAALTATHGGPDTVQQPALSQMPLHHQQQLASAIASAQNAAQNMHPPPISMPPQAPNSANNSQPGAQHHQGLPSQYHHAAVQHPRAQLPPQQISHPNARVFKLQFDARRIICCSQDPKIVGWDFANGDEAIMECSRFFSTPR
ncbi:MAG: hypothetical protein Q9207_007631 [Kuettlingeria erythrocarpa]